MRIINFGVLFLFILNLNISARSMLMDNTVADIVEKVSASVVHITAKQNVQTYSLKRAPGFGGIFDFFFKVPNNVIPRESGIGTGFIYDEKGLVLTNHHVIAGADSVSITLKDGRVFDAKYHGGDPSRDVAILKIEDKDFSGNFDSSMVASFGDSSALRVGEWVIAIGSPFKLDHTVTIGIVSAKGRSLHFSEDTSYNNLIQTDASINPGNSGGPLLNLKGEVIGINTAINPMGQGLGFAIPVNLASRIVSDLKKYGEVKRSWLGVYIDDLTPEMAHELDLKLAKGVFVRKVIENTPAQKAGLKDSDVILRVNGALTENREVLVGKIQEVPVGEFAELEVLRNGKPVQLRVQLTERGSYRNQVYVSKKGKSDSGLGLRARSLSMADRRNLGLGKRTIGVLVTAVKPGGIADRAGVVPGDVLVQIDQKRLNEPQDLNSVDPAGSHLFLVIREGYLHYLEY